MQLPEDAYGRKHGVTSVQLFAQNWLTVVPLVVMGVFVRFMMVGFPARVAHMAAWTPAAFTPDHPPMGASIAAGYLCIGLSLAFAVFIIPSMVRPASGVTVHLCSLLFAALALRCLLGLTPCPLAHCTGWRGLCLSFPPRCALLLESYCMCAMCCMCTASFAWSDTVSTCALHG